MLPRFFKFKSKACVVKCKRLYILGISNFNSELPSFCCESTVRRKVVYKKYGFMSRNYVKLAIQKDILRDNYIALGATKLGS